MSTTVIDSNPGPVSDKALDQLFREARTFSAWKPEPVSEDLLRQVYELTKWGPTSANGSPARFVFLTSPEAKERLLPLMMPLNVEKTKAAPVTVLVAYDTSFHDQLPKLFPQAPQMRDYFVNNEELTTETAFRNSSLEGAYLILAARAVGLDAGPMSGYDEEGVNKEFFPEGNWKVNFIVNLGHGDRSQLFPRLPRLEFEEVAQVL